jgi:N-methylhydantoinase A
VRRHRQLFGHGDPTAGVEIVTLRCRGIVPVDQPRWPPWAVSETAEPRSTRPVYFREAGPVATAVYDRVALALGQRVAGPAIVEEWASTVIVPPGWAGRLDAVGSLVLTRDDT